MTIPTTYRNAAVLSALLVLTGCSDRDPAGPAAAQGEVVALASARKPVRTELNETFSNELPCGTFTALSRGRISGHETTFFDRSGNAVRLQFHYRYRATITNTTSGKTLADNAAYNGTVDLVTGVFNVNGRIYDVKDGGNGIRIKDVGRLVFDAEGNVTFEAGRHDVGGFGDPTAQYCAAVA